YSADTDIGELQISFDLTDNLTLTSETAYGTDTVYSMQDFNRFNTAPGAWGGNSLAIADHIARGILRTDLGPNLTFCDPQLGCSDRLVAVDVSTSSSTQFSQEFRLASNYEGPFNFSLGGNFLRGDSLDKYYVFINSISMVAAISNRSDSPYVLGETDNSECLLEGYAPGEFDHVYGVTRCVYFDPNPIESVNDQGHNYFLSKNPYKLISYAVFGEAYYEIADNLKVTAGLRWTVDKKEAPRVPTWILAGSSVGYPVAEVIEQEWREPTGRLTVDWKPDLGFTDETMVYGSYAHGYKAGGANPPGYIRVFYGLPQDAMGDSIESATRPRTFDPEFVDAFELGSKNTLADGRVTMNLAAFYYDYKDYQISEIVDRSAFNRNFDATVWGIELEADWRPFENLRLGFKGGYEKTRIADHEQAIDLMDRTAGDPNWVVVRPFPTYASSCILPSWLYAHEGIVFGGSPPNLYNLGGASGGNPAGCEIAYIHGVDPVTELPYVPYPTVGDTGNGTNSLFYWHPGTYPGWDPATAPDGGEGIMKSLGGNELPNAPQWTATITADYTIPLPNEWLATLHTDLHWQSQSWWRVFNDHEYNRLDEYFTMNLAAIFTNEEAGWKVMAYIKNVTDETAITGAFLNSDDTGLTTNVFLTEPRLYGLRVTKDWSGGSFSLPFGMSREGPYPLTVELGGQVQRHEANNTFMEPSFNGEFEGPLNLFDEAQDADLDWGDGREVKVTWRPGSGPWSASAGLRYGKTNGSATPQAQVETKSACVYNAPDVCQYLLTNPKYANYVYFSLTNHADASIFDREEHQLIDFAVGYDIGIGGLNRSTVSAGMRRARLESTTNGNMRGTPDWVLEDGFVVPGAPVTHTVYDAWATADREFEGWGPVVSWDAAYPLVSFEAGGRFDIDWSISGGMLFGERDTVVTAEERARFYDTPYTGVIGIGESPLPFLTMIVPLEEWRRS
ncbi:MAG TPA: TonB-dependent receptor, partial [Caulobacteraceae bacterium]|nr:TonB-dependent receptor [Caulobacteraceae bacterium]